MKVFDCLLNHENRTGSVLIDYKTYIYNPDVLLHTGLDQGDCKIFIIRLLPIFCPIDLFLGMCGW